MNRTVISRILTSALLVSSAFAASASETNVTYVNMESYRHRGPVATQFRFASELPKDERMGGTLSLMGFYRHSYHKADWGKGLGINNTNEFNSALNSVAVGELCPQQISGADSDWAATVRINPEHYAIGANLNYFQSLSELYDGLYLFANTAFAQDNRRDNLDVSGTNAANLKPFLVQTASKKGRYSETSWQSKACVEDPEIGLGYKFFDEEGGMVSLNIAGSLPTGTEPNGELINEPLVGSRHFRLGAGLLATANLWSDEDKSLKAFFDLTYRYAFERSVITLPRLKGMDATLTNMNWGHLYTVSLLAGTAISNPVQSVSDFYGNKAKVKPGSEFDGVAMLAFNTSNFTVDLGYQLKFQQSHTATPETAHDGRTIIHADGATGFVANTRLIAATNLDWKREDVIRHTLFANAGAVMKDWSYPCHFGIGGAIGISHKKQITPELWQINAKVGVSF